MTDINISTDYFGLKPTLEEACLVSGVQYAGSVGFEPMHPFVPEKGALIAILNVGVYAEVYDATQASALKGIQSVLRTGNYFEALLLSVSSRSIDATLDCLAKNPKIRNLDAVRKELKR